MTGKQQLINSLKKLLPPQAPVEMGSIATIENVTQRLTYIEARLTWQRRVLLALAAIVAYLSNKLLNLGLDLDHLIGILTAALK